MKREFREEVGIRLPNDVEIIRSFVYHGHTQIFIGKLTTPRSITFTPNKETYQMGFFKIDDIEKNKKKITGYVYKSLKFAKDKGYLN